MKRKLTQQMVREFVRRLGGTFRKDAFGDFRLKISGNEYFTTDLTDVIGTARIIAGSHPNINSAEDYLSSQGMVHLDEKLSAYFLSRSTANHS